VSVLGLDHASISVGDLERSLAFYHGLLGLAILGTGDDAGPEVAAITGFPGARVCYADLDTGSGHILELLQYLTPQGTALAQELCDPGSGHIALRVDDVVATLAHLRQGGVTARADLVEIPGPAAWRGARCVYVQDPDGVTVELIERPDAAQP
jgi:lactoylglutathione lyase/glyoxylase I family protein